MDKIELNPQEAEWVIVLGNFTISVDDKDRFLKLKTAELLSRSLLSRGAVPEVRFKYFTEPEYNLSNTRKSHEDIFAMNGTEGEAILSHPNFLKYLKYFVYGAELPESLKSELVASKDTQSYDDEFVEEAVKILKKHLDVARGIEHPSFEEEVFKLSLDLGVELIYAKQLRNNVMTWRY